MRPSGGAGVRQYLRLLAAPRFAAFCAAETVAFFGDSVFIPVSLMSFYDLRCTTAPTRALPPTIVGATPSLQTSDIPANGP